MRMSKRNQHRTRLPILAGGVLCTAVLASCGKLPASVTPTTSTTTPSSTTTPALLPLPKKAVTVLVNDAEVPRLSKLIEQAHIPQRLVSLDPVTYKQFLQHEIADPAALAVTNWSPPSTLTSQMGLDQIAPLGTSTVGFDVDLPLATNIELSPTLVLDIYTHALGTWNALPLRTLNPSLSSQTEKIQTAVPRNSSYLFAALNNYIASVGSLSPTTQATSCATPTGCISISPDPNATQSVGLTTINGNFALPPANPATATSYPLEGSEVAMIAAQPRDLKSELDAIAIAERLSTTDGLPKSATYTGALSSLANQIAQEESTGS